MELRTVVSFSLYGFVNKYIGGLLQNCKDINRIYPDFWIYVYIGVDVDKDILHDRFWPIRNLQFIETGQIGHINMSYRFIAIDREEVGVMFSRDCDSRINERDQFCIDEFLKSDKLFQIIRDHEQHKVLVLGGTFGIKKGALSFSLHNALLKHNDLKHMNEYDHDQQFLSNDIYPVVKKNTLVFDSFFNFQGETPIKIPLPYREVYGEKDHVGLRHMPVDLNDPFGEHGPWYPYSPSP